jgi:transcriptional regulator with GAF, ATPase, and Fis domain
MLSVDRPPPPGRVRGHLGDGRHDGWSVNMTDIQLPDVFVEMADTLVADFDVLDFMHLLTDRCTALLDVSAAGLLLSDQRGTLRFAAASTEAGRLLELFQLQVDEGPCLDCFHTGQPVMVADIATATDRWPQFAPVAASHGYAAVCALPMRLRSEVIGALNLFINRVGSLAEDKQRIAQALADVATIGLLQERSISSRDILTTQLETALHSRIIIEQAKGVLAERLGIDPGRAFELLRDSARSGNRKLAELAGAVVDGSEQLPVPADSGAGQGER